MYNYTKCEWKRMRQHGRDERSGGIIPNSLSWLKKKAKGKGGSEGVTGKGNSKKNSATFGSLVYKEDVMKLVQNATWCMTGKS